MDAPRSTATPVVPSAPGGVVVKKKATLKKKKGAKKVVPLGATLPWDPNKGLTIREEVFCRYYVLNESTRNNATLSYDLAYEKNLDEQPKDDAVYEPDYTDAQGIVRPGKLVQSSSYDRCYAMCATEGSRLVRKPYIAKRVTVLLNEMLSDEFVDGELAKVIAQDKELHPKVAAIREYNALKKRITKQLDVKVGLLAVVEHFYGEVDKLEREKYGKPQP